ncbi:MAG: putative glycoside hydrolase [Treponema sp.]
MKLLLIFIAALFIPGTAFSQEKEINPLYTLPKIIPGKNSNSPSLESGKGLLASETGIYKILKGDTIYPLWTEGKAKQILYVEQPAERNKSSGAFYFLTSKGILFSKDLKTFETRNSGLPVLTIKKYDGSTTSFEKQIADVKDIAFNPQKPEQMVCATKDRIYLSEDAGQSWTYYSSPRLATSGIKAVAVATLSSTEADGSVSSDDYVFCSHATLGFFYSKVSNKKMVNAAGGLAGADPNVGSDEVSDILPVLCRAEDGSIYTEIFLAQTFIPRIYRFDFEKKRSVCVYKGEEPADTIDGLFLAESSILYSSPKSVKAFDIASGGAPSVPDKFNVWKKLINLSPSPIFSAWFSQSESGFKTSVTLNEIWMINSEEVSSPYAKQISSQKSLYVPAYQAQLPNGIEKFRKLILDNKLNSLVIDMKDDYGLLRYNSKNPEILKKAKTSQYAVDLEKFVSEFKKDDIYLIARIVVFKDRNLSKYDGGKYAVWNKSTNSPWIGTRGYETDESGKRVMTYYDENWVDPFCPEVWEYDVAIAKELIARGFDEIQFDYIRFPTDGTNLSSAQFRWQSEGMDKESALISFLSYARENIHAPIGIDIYGANGWYRTAARTGQDVETLAEYVDVICPMFYPSHFENKFLNYEPYEERPYRIYFYGTYRNTIIARNKVVVRPWVQTFFLNVPYDRTYYDTEYVRKEMFGVRDSVNRGYMHWNNAGNYAKLSPDPEDAEYNGKAYEANPKYRKPAIGSSDKEEVKEAALNKEHESRKILLWDSVYNQEFGNL